MTEKSDNNDNCQHRWQHLVLVAGASKGVHVKRREFHSAVLQWATIGVNGYVSILIAYFVLRWSTGESINAVALLTNVMPVCLLPCFLFLPFTLWRRHILSSLSNLIICIIFGVYWGPMLIHSKIDSQGSASAQLSILSHNMAQDQTNYDGIDSLIERTDADIVLLQEVTGDYIKDHWPQLRTRYPYQVNGPLLGAKSVGMGILSKYPLGEVKNFKLDEDGLVFQQRAEVSLGDKPIAVYNVHTTFPWIRLERDPWLSRIPWPVYDDKIRRKEITNLLRQLQSETVPFILAGDFNLADFSEDYERLTSVLGDAYRSAGSGLGFTWPANRTPSVNIPIHRPLVRIDYIFHSDQWQPKYAHILEKTGSDHLPLFIGLDLRDNP